MIEDDQTVSAFSAPNRRDAFLKARSEAPKQKGLSYTDLLIDNIVGLDNEYESFGEAFGKSFNEDEIGTLKNMAVSAYEGAKEFVTSPIETSKDIATEISDSVSRLGAESLDGRIKRMYGVGYQDATEEQVTKAREAVIGDAITASSLVPAAKGATTVAKVARLPKTGQPKLSSVEDIINAEDFELLDENFIPVNKPSVESLKSEIGYMLGEELTPQEGLAKIKKANSEDLGLYKEGTTLGDSAIEKSKIFSSLKEDELLKLAEDLPHWEDSKYGDYLKNTLVPVAKYAGADWSALLETLNDISSYLPTKENPQLAFLTEKPLPKKAPIGERAATGSAPRAADPKAEKLGFFDTVYHTSVSPQEFTEFDLQKSFSGAVRAAQDLLGVHVGTARAAAERNFQAYRKDDTPTGFTMELRARATDPLMKGDLARMFGKAPEDIFSPGNKPLTEADIGEAISFYEDMLFKDKQPPKNARELAAVAFRRELAREGFTHIPYINDVEDPGSISYIMLVDRPKDSPAVLRDVRAEFDPKKITEPDLRFAQGGMVEDDQMNRLMQEGGMADDGMNREPVTGNEIPPGSLASEVRDDIPAQLSEGEYVVPADVLRYYGVRFFEDLRAQAKQGMMEMESDGRIGGTPVNAQGVPMEGQEEQLTPEEEQMLMEALGGSGAAPTGMAYGGMIEQPAPTPYQDQATMYQMPAGMGGSMGMQEGGVVEEPFDRTKFTLGNDTSSVIETRRYINPTTKEERTVNFLNGIALGIIPEGFVPWTKELADQPKPGTETGTTTGTPEVKTERDDRGRDRDQTATTGEGSMGWAEKNFDAITSDPLGYATNVYKDASQPASGLGKMFGMTGLGKITGDFNTLGAISSLEAAKSETKPGSTEANTIQGYIDALSNSLDSNVANALYSTGLVATGNQKITAKDKLKGTGVTTTSSAPSGTPAGTPTTSTSKDSDNKPTASGNKLGFSPSTPSSNVGVTRTGGDKGVGFGASVGKVDTKSTSDKGLSMGTSGGTNTGNNPGNPNAPGYSGSSGTGNVGTGTSGSYGQGGSNATRRAEGGLISKPEKTTRGKKGLAS
jgi:hypothetical protein